ncbi:hypothetical protein LZ30DRAFT_477685 [Colletotrichum cereale]|nr:hypothetical protein LZ30DRAFT_477685 [Colletotrichum cereale]
MADSIANLASSIIESLERFLIASKDSSDESIRLSLHPKLLDELSRFRAWSGETGALRVGQDSLDSRLRDASHIRTQILQLLDELHHFLLGEWDIIIAFNSLRDDPDEEGPLDLTNGRKVIEQIATDVADMVDCLSRLSTPIHDPAPHDQIMASRAANIVSLEQLDIQHIRDKFSGVEEYLACRLGRAISRRREYFQYREALEPAFRTHGGTNEYGSAPSARFPSEFEQEDNASSDDFSDDSYSDYRGSKEVRKTPMIASEKSTATIPRPANSNQLLPLSATAPTPRAYSFHGTSSAFSSSANPGEDWTKISYLAEIRRIQNRIARRNYREKLKIRLEDLERRAGQEGTSTAEKPDTMIIERRPTYEFPRLPEDALNKHVECPYCHAEVFVRTAASWRKHLLRDLKPYSCLAKVCTVSDSTFSSLDKWMQHMLQHHLRTYHCPLGCEKTFTSTSESASHLTNVHPGTVPERHAKTLIRLSSQPLSNNTAVTCPLCHQSQSSLVSYRRHVGNHQMELALNALAKASGTEDCRQTDAEPEVTAMDGEPQGPSAKSLRSTSLGSRLPELLPVVRAMQRRRQIGLGLLKEEPSSALPEEQDVMSHHGRGSRIRKSPSQSGLSGDQPFLDLNREWFIPIDGIDQEVITADINRYLGDDASVQRGQRWDFETRQFAHIYWIRSFRPLAAADIDNLRADSWRWELEKRRQYTEKAASGILSPQSYYKYPGCQAPGYSGSRGGSSGPMARGPESRPYSNISSMQNYPYAGQMGNIRKMPAYPPSSFDSERNSWSELQVPAGDYAPNLYGTHGREPVPRGSTGLGGDLR